MIFSFLLNFFTTGLTFSGKLKGIVRQTWPSWYNIFWDQRTLADRTDPPTTLNKPISPYLKDILKNERGMQKEIDN